MYKFVHFKEGLRILLSCISAKIKGTKKYTGNAGQICKKITKQCWNGKYFQTSTRNFSQFYTRDFGICAEALIKLGHRKEVINTLDYALDKFRKHRSITTSISPSGKPYDFPYFAADSLPFIIHSIKSAKAEELLKKYESFFLEEIKKYYEKVFDNETGMVNANIYFSSMKDYSKRSSSTYDNCMAAMLSNDLNKMNFFNPFAKFDIKKQIEKKLWNGKYFYDDLNKKKVVYGDVNIFPFWTGVFDSKEMFMSCLKEMQKAGIDRPFPLKYSAKKEKEQRMILLEAIIGDYERDSIWMHLAMCFLDVLRQYDKASFSRYKNQLKKVIEKHKNFLEVFDKNGKPFSSLFYLADEGMLWASKFLR